MQNPSIDTWHVEFVPNECQTIQHCMNWRTYGDINKEWNPEQLAQIILDNIKVVWYNYIRKNELNPWIRRIRMSIGVNRGYKVENRRVARNLACYNQCVKLGYSEETATQTVKQLRIDGKRRFKKEWTRFFVDVKF